MEIYLVGGAVRDQLLGLPVRERDWVVVGATVDEMLRLGYKPVGKDFPVFLHPETGEEYALARTERKTAPGYTGFETCADPDVTLEQDLQRRDLTINAMAETPDGELIDPYGGAEDLDNGVLRHVSPAFSEDPVRILRVARFAARFAHWGFHVAHDTNALMRHMVRNGEVDHLVTERVWAEFTRALAEPDPQRFFDVLYGCGALARLFPELEPLYLVEDLPPHRRAERVFPVLAAATALSDKAPVRFAALLCDLDRDHDPDGGPGPLESLDRRLPVPNAFRELAQVALRYRDRVHRVTGLGAAALLDLLGALDVWRRRERLDDLLRVCQADARVRGQDSAGEYPPGKLLRRAQVVTLAVKADKIGTTITPGKEIGARIRQQRLAALEELLATR
jgi:tRNA nucleotidyltransferase (CCA-adding enzyme)